MAHHLDTCENCLSSVLLALIIPFVYIAQEQMSVSPDVWLSKTCILFFFRGASCFAELRRTEIRLLEQVLYVVMLSIPLPVAAVYHI